MESAARRRFELLSSRFPMANAVTPRRRREGEGEGYAEGRPFKMGKTPPMLFRRDSRAVPLDKNPT
jgi:hypothetical protein